MAKLEASAIEKYQAILAKDPNSQVFAPLAETYREMGQLEEAQTIVTAGVQRHPQFVGGLVTFAKVLRDLNQLEKALETLKRAALLAPENLLAHQLTAEIELANKNPKGALKAFKMILFLNPNSQTALTAIQKLESVTADEYDEDVFAMEKLEKLPSVNLSFADSGKSKQNSQEEDSGPSQLRTKPLPRNKALERMLSLIDAFIVRNDLEKAQALLKDSLGEFGEHPEITKRMKTLQIFNNDSDEALPLKPLRNRIELIREKKLEVLEMMLRKIDDYRGQG